METYPSNIYLIGFMAAGKTTVGRELDDLVDDWTFVDLDERIEQRASRTLADIFRQDGEEEFRRLEREALLHLARQETMKIVATGGGACVDEENWRIMAETGRIVALLAPLAVLCDRIQADEGERPLAGNDDALRQLYKTRRPIYARAPTQIWTHNQTATDTARTLLQKLGMWR